MVLTKINKLSMKGFKSFANHTELVFSDKFNCILGPNGSGKSNVLDAICFVLGKSSAKGLRAEKSANLIYNGGKKGKKAKEARVSIYFDNSSKIFGDYKEVKITRVVKSSGQSDYFLNDKKVTRQELLELLSKAKINPDGYNIILQGDIIRMVEMSSIERRKVIEEISGINIYEEKKEKALRELNKVEEKINRADIILTEKKTYLKELKKERDQAAKYLSLKEKIDRNKKTIIVYNINNKRKELEKINLTIKKIEEDIEKKEKRIKELENNKTKLKKELDSINKELEEKGEVEEKKKLQQVNKLKVDLAINKERVETIKQELKKINDRKDSLREANKELFSKIKLLEKEKNNFNNMIKSKNKELSLIEEKISSFKKKHNMNDVGKINDEIASFDKEAELIEQELSSLRQKQQNLLREKDKLEIRLEQADEQILKLKELESINKEAILQLKKKKELYKSLTKELTKALSNDSSYEAQLNNLRLKEKKVRTEYDKLLSKKNVFLEQHQALKAIRKLKEEIKGIYGIVAELGSVDKKYSLPLEIAAGNRMTSIVVDNEEVARTCINYLRKNKLGVATFLPLNKIRGPNDIDLPKGAIAKAKELISFDKKFKKVFDYVFGNTIVVDNLKKAKEIGIGNYRMVTLEGDIVELSGAMQGGFRQKKLSIGFQEKELNNKINNLENELNELNSLINNLEQKKRDNEELITRLRREKADLEGSINAMEKNLHLKSNDLEMNQDMKKKLKLEEKEIDKKLDDIIKIISEKNRLLASIKIKKQELRNKLSELRNPSVLAQLNSFEEQKNELKEEIMILKTKLNSVESEIKSVLGPEAERITKIIKEHEKEENNFTKELKEKMNLIKTLSKELKEKESSLKEFMLRFKSQFKKRDELSKKIQEIELSIKELEINIHSLEEKINNQKLIEAKIKAELAGLEEENKQFFNVKIYENKDVNIIKKEIKEFEKLIESMGAINMKAVEIYDKLISDFKELEDKKKKLIKEKEEVKLLINELDTKKKDLFFKTYDVISKNFKEIFAMLSGKGEGYLELEDPEDVFNGGLTIKVRLTNKKHLDIRGLSGGEKTLTALAFLFAVQEYEPASFYILDEVDAALDKRNSKKLGKLIRAYCKNAQYIIISHNDTIIAEADTLYGVSMNKETGISKVTSLRI